MNRKHIIWAIVCVVILIIAVNIPAMVRKLKGPTKKAPEPGTGTTPATGVPTNTTNTGGTKPTTGAPVMPVAFDPEKLLDAIYDDCTCLFCTRNTELYEQLLALSSVQLKAAYDYWVYWEYDDKESLASMIAKQTSWTNSTFALQQKKLAAAFKQQNLL